MCFLSRLFTSGLTSEINGVVQKTPRPQKERPMQLHGNARTTPYIRREMVRRVRERAEPVTETAAALGVSARTVYKWLDRYEREGEAGLLDRSSRPTCCPHATSAGVVRQIDKLHRRRLTAWQISRRLAVPHSTPPSTFPLSRSAVLRNNPQPLHRRLSSTDGGISPFPGHAVSGRSRRSSLRVPGADARLRARCRGFAACIAPRARRSRP